MKEVIMNENDTKMTDSIPQIDGPKLSPFRGAIENIQFKEYLGPSITRYQSKDNALSHVFRVHIEGKEYCLKVFGFVRLEQLWLSVPFVPDDDRWPTDHLVRYSLDPFYAECRAFGRLEEEGKNGSIAVQCHGYIFLPQAIEHQIQKEFNINWCRQPGDEKLLLRAILTDYLRSDLCRGEQLCALRSKLEKLNDMGILNMNIREENYGRGLLIDFSMAITAPHLRLVVGPRSKGEIFQDFCYDRISFDKMAERVREDGDDPRESFTTLSPQNIARVSDKGESNDKWESEESNDEEEAEAEEQYWWAAYNYYKVTGRDALDSYEGEGEADDDAAELFGFAAYNYTKVTGRSAPP
ncbi:kinetochore Sim4 complex subunit FTA2-domain-containing protein [Xylaria cubensis]|nr:kinetochore Sim4 complex subunit FTA2-domain-containing protein [Xylaria cubensis]